MPSVKPTLPFMEVERKEKPSPHLETFFQRHLNFNSTHDKFLNIRPSQRWFDQLSRCVEADTCLFEKMYEERQGPTVCAEDLASSVFHPVAPMAKIQLCAKAAMNESSIKSFLNELDRCFFKNNNA